jgi:uncharacterized repeat protein (TIGR02543 family)/LPXTG-motif cell wall-anchored protein
MIVSASTSIDQLGADIDGEAADDRFGVSVSLSDDGTIVAIGGGKNDAGATDGGHVQVYQYSGGAWSQLGDDINGDAATEQSGWAISLSSDGTIVAIGAPLNEGTPGRVKVYQYSSGAWSQLGSDIDGEAVDDQFGRSVSLSSDGTILAIGARYNDGNGDNAGRVQVYQYSSGAWSQLGADIDGEAVHDEFGRSVSLSSDGTILAIGAPGNDAGGYRAGHVRVYQYSSGAWSQLGDDIDGEAADDRSGGSVSLSSDGTILAIGAPFNDESGSDAGHVRVYQYSSGTWSQLGDDIDGEAADDRSGYSVSLSSDGTKLAVGAHQNDGNGTNAGHVRVHQYSSGTWSQLGADINGETAGNPDSGDKSGWSVSLSSDGTKVAIGAPLNDGNGTNAGHVRVYSISTSLSITYDSQGGSAVSDGDATTTVGGTIAALPTEPTREGYTFAGWFTAATGGTEITTNAAHNQTADFTLYAQWTANPTTTTTTTTTVAPTTTTTTTTTMAPTTIVLPATGSSDGTASQVLLVLGLGGLLVLFTRRRLDVRD